MRRTLVSIAVLALLAALAPAARADHGLGDPPDHDDFADARGIALGGADAADTTTATDEAGEPSPCAGISHTVWYRFETPEPIGVVANTFGSTYDTVLAVYTGDDLASLQEVACNDDVVDLQSEVAFDAAPGETYWIQAGGFYGDTGDLEITVVEGATLSGTVTLESTGEPLEYVCVVAEDEDVFAPRYAITAADGTYRLAVTPGTIVLSFWDCWSPRRAESEWYDDVSNRDQADRLVIEGGAEVTGLDAALATYTPPPPPPPTEVGITDLRVSNRSISTDGHDTGIGWNRLVEVDVANTSDQDADLGYVEVTVCPDIGDCKYLGWEVMQLAGGASNTVEFSWDGLGSVGDQTVYANVWACGDADPTNNHASTSHYSVVGGLGVGANLRPDSTTYDDRPWWLEASCGDPYVIVPEPI